MIQATRGPNGEVEETEDPAKTAEYTEKFLRSCMVLMSMSCSHHSSVLISAEQNKLIHALEIIRNIDETTYSDVFNNLHDGL